MDDLIAEFLTETAESLEVVDVELVKFEQNPNERGTLDNIFRLVHTVKGTCGFLGLPRLEAVAHAGETLLGRFRDGKLEVTPTAVTLVLRSIDRIKEILAGLEQQAGVEPEGDDSELIHELEEMAEGRGPGTTAPVEDKKMLGVGDFDPTLGRVIRPGEVSMDELEAAFANADAPDFMQDEAPVAAVAEPIAAKAPEKAPEPVKDAPKPAVPVAAKAPTDGDDVAASLAANQSIRVSVDVLEDLMTLVSELVLTRNQLLQISRGRDDSAFATPLQRLSTITGELQDSVMKTRMQPIGAAWKKLPRLVRDLSNELGKKIDLIMDGENTELDRQVAELIRDPLTHMVRNSADHGLETTADRIAVGKPINGTIRLSAFHEGGYIVIRIADDGKGLNTDRIREKAIEKNLISRAEAENMSDAQIHRFIFAAGFSTAAAVTNLSGRGVGMDVVRTNIEQIGGQIDLHSVNGSGTTFTIKIPLTLAIVSALIVGVGGQRFAVPQTTVLELVRAGANTENKIESISGARVLRLRDTLLPLLELGNVLNVGRKDSDQTFVMVIAVGERRFGLVVDDVLDTEEIVVKPLAGILRDANLFSGATILGDGSVVLIFDPNALAERAGDAIGETETDEVRHQTAVEHGRRAMLIFKAGSSAPKAVELSRVTRLEHVEASTIELIDGRAMLQYRGRLMPILQVEPGMMQGTEGTQALLVFSGEGYSMGLAVSEIVDVVEDRLELELAPDRLGFLGTAVIAGKAAEILDVDHYLVRALAEHSKRPQAQSDDERNAA